MYTCRTHTFDHIAAVALYMISHQITDVMTGQTLQSMLVIIYRHHRHTLHSTGRDGEPRRHISTCQRDAKEKADKQKKHRRDGRIKQLTARADWFSRRLRLVSWSCQLL